MKGRACAQPVWVSASRVCATSQSEGLPAIGPAPSNQRQPAASECWGVKVRQRRHVDSCLGLRAWQRAMYEAGSGRWSIPRSIPHAMLTTSACHAPMPHAAAPPCSVHWWLASWRGVRRCRCLAWPPLPACSTPSSQVGRQLLVICTEGAMVCMCVEGARKGGWGGVGSRGRLDAGAGLMLDETVQGSARPGLGSPGLAQVLHDPESTTAPSCLHALAAGYDGAIMITASHMPWWVPAASFRPCFVLSQILP